MYSRFDSVAISDPHNWLQLTNAHELYKIWKSHHPTNFRDSLLKDTGFSIINSSRCYAFQYTCRRDGAFVFAILAWLTLWKTKLRTIIFMVQWYLYTGTQRINKIKYTRSSSQ
jgi:hypothetical protein